jgi:hypothetical protein
LTGILHEPHRQSGDPYRAQTDADHEEALPEAELKAAAALLTPLAALCSIIG